MCMSHMGIDGQGDCILVLMTAIRKNDQASVDPVQNFSTSNINSNIYIQVKLIWIAIFILTVFTK